MFKTVVVRAITAVTAIVMTAAAQGVAPAAPQPQSTVQITVPDPPATTSGRQPYERLFVTPGQPSVAQPVQVLPRFHSGTPRVIHRSPCGVVVHGLRSHVDPKMVFAVPSVNAAIQRIDPPVCK